MAVSCGKYGEKISQFAAGISGGISHLASKAAYTGGNLIKKFETIPPAGQKTLLYAAPVTGALSAIVAVSLWARNRQKQRTQIFKTGFTYNPQEFDSEEGQKITNEFGGARLSLSTLHTLVGPNTLSKPMLKMGGEDDIFLLHGPNGHVFYSMPDENVAQIVAVVPRTGRGPELSSELNEFIPKYVVMDILHDDEYETRDAEVAKKFQLALGRFGKLRKLRAGDKSWDKPRLAASPISF